MSMSLLKRLEAKDMGVKSQFSRFVLVGGISTIINYALFFLLFRMFGINYIAASATGYVVGTLFGYIFNARLTFRSKPGLSVVPYFLVYLFSLIASLGVLKFFASSVGINPMYANILAIGFSTVTNFLGSRYIAFNEKFRLPHFFKSRIFIAVLLIKIIFAMFFASDFMTKLFIPFVNYFVANPLLNPYQHFLEIGAIKVFPYPPLMLFILSVPQILFGALSESMLFDLFAMRLPLLVADIAIFYFLYKIFHGKEKYTLLLYWASPIIFYITYIHGQLDIIPVAFLFASTYFLLGKRYKLSAVLLGAGLATKSFIIVVLPIYLIYLLKKKVPAIKIAIFLSIFLIVYGVFLLPYVFSKGFIHMVFLAEEQLRLFNLSADFKSGLVYYIAPAAYGYVLLKALSFKKITKDIFFVLLALTLTLLVTLLNPARGWYLWLIPFALYFFLKKGARIWPYIFFIITYLLYFLFVPDSDVFNVFQLIAPTIATKMTPYNYLLSIGLPANLLVNLLFTALNSVLIYTVYLIYKNGIKNSLMFQEQNGIPVIGISGDSGTGKTTLAESLANLFGRHRVTLVYGDDAHKWERQDNKWSALTHLNPEANFIHMHYKQLQRLKKGYTIRRRHYDHRKGKFTKPILIKPKDIIISEGLHTLFINESNFLYELKIYIDTDPSLRLLWKIKRDMKERKYSAEQIKIQIKRRKQDSEKFISPQKYYSDVILSYKPEEKIDFNKLEKNVPLFAELQIKNDIPIENLLGALSDCKTLNTYMEYPDHRFQKIVIGGKINKEDVRTVLNSLEIDYEEYEVDFDNIKDGIDGVIQVILLYCLNERLKNLSGRDDYE